VNPDRQTELERRLEESERERRELLETLQDTLQLQRMAEEAGATREPAELLEAFAQAATRICPWTAAEVRLRDCPTDRNLSLRAFRSGCDALVEAEIRELDEEGVLGWAQGVPRPTALPSLAQNGETSWVVVPLQAGGEAVAVALLKPADPLSPTTRQLEMLRLVAAQTAVALDNLSHMAEIRHGYAELRSLHQVAAALGSTLDPQRLFGIVLEALRERVAPRVVALGIDGEGSDPLRVLADGADPGDCADLLSRISATGSTLRLDVSLATGRGLERFGCRRALGLPLATANGTCLGALLVADGGDSGLEAADAVEWLESVASLLAASIDNSRLYEEVVASNRRMSELQSKMIQVGRLEGIGQLAGGIAHEINNPLQVILGRVQILQAKAANAPECSTDLARIESETMRIAHIVRSLQNFARQDGGDAKGRPTRLSQIADSVLELVAHRIRRQSIEIVREGFESSPLVSGDIDQLRQTVLNLCLNALHAMPEGGTLRMRAGMEGVHAALEVWDSGPGIAPEDIPRIFDPFFGRGPGMGLGLAIGFAVAQRHGGSLEVVPGSGTGFRLLLPPTVPESVNPG
jgi:signal transduction histidine kinase